MPATFDDRLVPRLERAIGELSEDLDARPDARERRRLIAFFHSTIAQCRDQEACAAHLGARRSLSGNGTGR